MPKENRFRVNPKAETSPQIKSGPACSYRYAYARSADSRAADESGQDYLTFSDSPAWFAFALCDGVSQSFFGEIAARILGDALLRWLEALSAAGMTVSGEALSKMLGELTTRATQLVHEYPIPAEISPMLREVLEQKRELGSEATFLCGRIDLPNATLPHGRLLLAWMGDSRLRFWGPAGERSAELGETFHTDQRWSTRRGPVNGRPHLFTAPLASDGGRPEVVRVLAYSDGLSSLDDHDEALSNVALGEMIAAAAESATSDDISLLEIWTGPVSDSVAASPPLAARGSKPEPEDGGGAITRAALDRPSAATVVRRDPAADRSPTPTVVRRDAAADGPPARTRRGGGLGATPTVPYRPREARRWSIMGLLLVALVLGAGGLILGLVTGQFSLPGLGRSATPTATWTPESLSTATGTATPSPTTPASPTATATLTLAPTWTPTGTATPTLSATPPLTATVTLSPTATLTPSATAPVSILPTPAAAATELRSPVATPVDAGGEQ